MQMCGTSAADACGFRRVSRPGGQLELSSELVGLEEEEDNGHAETAERNPNAQSLANSGTLPEGATDSLLPSIDELWE